MFMVPKCFVDMVTNFLLLLHVTYSMKIVHSTENISLQFHKEYPEADFSDCDLPAFQDQCKDVIISQNILDDVQES